LNRSYAQVVRSGKMREWFWSSHSFSLTEWRSNISLYTQLHSNFSCCISSAAKPKPAKGKAEHTSESRKGKDQSVSHVAQDQDRKQAPKPLRIANIATATQMASEC
jgi:hypothetical protein